MAGKTGNGGSNLSPLHNKGDGGIKTMAGTMIFPGLQEHRGKTGKDTQKGLYDNLLGKKGIKVVKSGGMAENMISDRAKEKIETNKYYTKKAIELAKKIGALDEEGNFIKMIKKTIDGAIIKVDNIENNIILSVYYDDYINEVGVNITTGIIFGEEATNSNGILGSKPLWGEQLHELLDKVLK